MVAEATGSGAVEVVRRRLRAKPITIALVDLHLKGEWGFDVVESIRELDATIRTILISGLFEMDDEKEAQRLGIEIAEKPHFIEPLLIAILANRPLHEVVSEREPHSRTLDAITEAQLTRRLHEKEYNVTRTAESLGIDRSTLQRKIQRHGIKFESRRRR